jgi:uncharacterized membrane protein
MPPPPGCAAHPLPSPPSSTKLMPSQRRVKAQRRQAAITAASEGDLARNEGREVMYEVESTTVTAYQGDMPSPEMLAAFDQVVPGSAERILRSYEKEGDHRRAMDRELVGIAKSDSEDVARSRARGQWLAFTVAAGFLVLALTMVVLGRGPEVLAPLAAALATVVAPFLSSWFKRQEAPKEGAQQPAKPSDQTPAR